MSNPSFLNVPYRFKAGTLYSQIPDSGLGDFVVSRTTTPTANLATRVNAQGFIETVSDNVPRLDYPLGGIANGCPALLVEPSAVNSLFHSEAFDDVYWTKSGTTAQGNVATSPSNTLTADNIYPTVSGVDQRLQRAISIVNGTTYTSSIFAKANGINWIRFYAAQFNAAAFFNVQSGTIGTVQAGVTARIENYGNGWYRCSVTQTVTTTGTGQVYINLTDSNGSGTVTASGTNGILFWGAQLEVGSIATSYIPTTTAAITRGADVITKTGVSSLIGQTEGTIYAELNVSNFTLFARAFAISDGTTSNRILFQKTSNNRLQLIVRTAGASIADIATGNNQATGNYKVAVAYANNDFVFYVNGSLIGSVTSGAVPACNQVFLGKIETSANSDQWNDRIRAVALYTTRLTNAQLQALTT